MNFNNRAIVRFFLVQPEDQCLLLLDDALLISTLKTLLNGNDAEYHVTSYN